MLTDGLKQAVINEIMMSREDDGKVDDHVHDLVMPGFRFHPTDEELIEFYLRRKVEGRRFNVELITFLDLYRYDPWELPALAAIGEKEWFFYVSRDRKYRNGDRPNRVTLSGYWKATGADRTICGEDSRAIGLKKTLVFYSGKAPKGIRSSWIMNEYRLPHTDTIKYHKTEISLCRVYKRPGVVHHHQQLPGTLSSNPSSSKLQTQPPPPPPTPLPLQLRSPLAGVSPSSSQSSSIDKKPKLDSNNNSTLYTPTPTSINANNYHNYMDNSSISTLEQLQSGVMLSYNQSYVLPIIPSQNQPLIPFINPEDKLWEDYSWNFTASK